MVFSISIPEAQFKAAEQIAKAENRTMSELVREALGRYEKERREETIANTGSVPVSAVSLKRTSCASSRRNELEG